MRLTCVIILCLILLQASTGYADTPDFHQSSLKSLPLVNECGVYAHHVVKPMLGLFDKVNQKIDKYDVEMKIKTQQVQQLEDKVTNLQIENTIYKTKIDTMAADLEELKNKVLPIAQQSQCKKENVQVKQLKEQVNSDAQRLIKYEADIQSKEEKIQQLESKIESLIDKAKKVESISQQKIDLLKSSNELQVREVAELKAKLSSSADKASECEIELNNQKEINIENYQKILESETSLIEQKRNIKSCGATGVYKVNLFKDSPFDVLCNCDIAGTGWIVIQQRIHGGVDFYQNWTTYQNGFGDFWDGDFFLGLEKIHRITSEQPHELYIYMQRFDDSSIFARYDEFQISGEDEQYAINKLGHFSGNTRDYFRFAKDQKFSTYDRENDSHKDKNCAVFFHNAWWNSFCFDSNLNGIYFNTEVEDHKSVHWDYHYSLKQVKMMVRPKALSK